MSDRTRIRQRPIPYSGDDSEAQWYRCSVCGFVCSTERDAQDGHGNGNTTTESTVSHFGVLHLTRMGLSSLFKPYGIASEGEWIAADFSYSYLAPMVSSGCPGCGTYNWRGTKRK